MTIKAVLYQYAERQGGTVDIENEDMGGCEIVSSDTASPNELRRRAIKKLRAMADLLEQDIKRRARAEGRIETVNAQR